MASTASNTILLNFVNLPHLKEFVAGGTIKPGHFIQRGSDGKAVVQATPGEDTLKQIAVENDLTSGDIDTAYSSGATLKALNVQAGMEVYAFVPASAAAIVIGDKLVFDGTGCLIKATSQADVTGTLTGTTDGALADVAAINLSTGDSYTDAAVNTAVNTAITSVNLQLKELQTALNVVLPENNGKVVAVALEAVDNSGGGTPARIRVAIV